MWIKAIQLKFSIPGYLDNPEFDEYFKNLCPRWHVDMLIIDRLIPVEQQLTKTGTSLDFGKRGTPETIIRGIFFEMENKNYKNGGLWTRTDEIMAESLKLGCERFKITK